jgi:hypothetical protein
MTEESFLRLLAHNGTYCTYDRSRSSYDYSDHVTEESFFISGCTHTQHGAGIWLKVTYYFEICILNK